MAPPGRHPGHRPRPLGSAVTVVRLPRRRLRPKVVTQVTPATGAKLAGGRMGQNDVRAKGLRLSNEVRERRWPANGWSSAAPGGPVAEGHGSSGAPPWPSASLLGVGCNDSSPARLAGSHGPEPSHAGYRRRTRRRPSEVRRFVRKKSPFGKRGEGEGVGWLTARASAAARSGRSEQAVGWKRRLSRRWQFIYLDLGLTSNSSYKR